MLRRTADRRTGGRLGAQGGAPQLGALVDVPQLGLVEAELRDVGREAGEEPELPGLAPELRPDIGPELPGLAPELRPDVAAELPEPRPLRATLARARPLVPPRAVLGPAS